MKQLLIFSLLLLSFTACLDDDDPCTLGFSQGDTFPLPDGRNVTVIAIEDQLCGCNVVCVEAGGLRIILQADGATVERDTLDGLFGPPRRDSIIFGAFTILQGPTYNEGFCGGNVPESDLCVGLDIVR